MIVSLNFYIVCLILEIYSFEFIYCWLKREKEFSLFLLYLVFVVVL